MRLMKKYTLLTAFFCLILSLFTLAGQAADTGVVSVSSWLNLRSAPSYSASVINQMPDNTEVTINGIEGLWYLLSYEGQTGYAHSDYINLYVKEETQETQQTQTSEDDASSVVGYVRAENGLNLRAGPSTSDSIIINMPNDSLIIIESATGYWYEIRYGDYTGYAHSAYIATDATEEQISHEDTTLTGYVSSGSGLNLRTSPSSSASRITILPYAAPVEILSDENGWYKVSYGSYTGYVSSSYITRTPLLANRSSSGARELSEDEQALADNILAYAKQFLGVPYVYGGESPSGFDCSGYVQYVFSHFGISLPRTATQQANVSFAVAVSKSELVPGDLVFFKNPNSSKAIGHVGIYVGNNQFIHASSPGDYVKYDSLGSSYYSSNYVTARRIIG